MTTRHPARKRAEMVRGKRAYYIRRSSMNGDGTTLFCSPERKPVYFDKATWAAWLLPSFAPEQHAQVELLPVGKEDVAFEDWLPCVLPDTMQPAEYITAIEAATVATRKGRDVTRRQVRQVEAKLTRR